MRAGIDRAKVAHKEWLGRVVTVERQTLRDWVSGKRLALETAQSNGTLARTKLDLKDEARSTFGERWASDVATMWEEELEAFCADMRLASVTVQQQVERIVPKHGRGIVLGIIAAGVLLFVLAAMGGSGTDVGPTAGFGLPIIAGIVVYFMAR